MLVPAVGTADECPADAQRDAPVVAAGDGCHYGREFFALDYAVSAAGIAGMSKRIPCMTYGI